MNKQDLIEAILANKEAGFESKAAAGRAGRNPQTGATIKIKASKTVGFKAGAALKADAAKSKGKK